nr:hypothetical protein OG546_35575 [Streptomyces antimycoticus]
MPVAGVLDGVEEFDAEFFGMSPKEAELTHPAHRLFLECCHQALEDGGYAAAEPGTTIGVRGFGHESVRPPAAVGDGGTV